MTQERDIAERLRTGEPCLEANGRPCRSMDAQSGCACAEAAAEITRLRTALADAEAKLVKARADALEDAANVAEQFSWMADIEWWLNATKREVSARSAIECAAAIRAMKT